MLFDTCDYVFNGAVGIKSFPAWEVFSPDQYVACGGEPDPPYDLTWDWYNQFSTGRETSTALVKAMGDYIDAATTNPCNNVSCSAGPIVDTGLPYPNQALPLIFNDWLNLEYEWRIKFNALENHLTDVQTNPTTVVFNQAYYDDCMTAWNAVMCGMRTLFKIVDNNDFPLYTP